MATAVLLCSELVTNAVQHAHVEDEPVGVRLLVNAQDCLIEVADGSPAPPRRSCPSEYDENGRGLQLVAVLSAAHGHCYLPTGGKTVWARMPLTKCPTAVSGQPRPLKEES